MEHLLALAGCGLTHVHLEVDGGEVPLLDGSAQGWVGAIAEAGSRRRSPPVPCAGGPWRCTAATCGQAPLIIAWWV